MIYKYLFLTFAVIKVARRGGGACNTTNAADYIEITRRVGFYVIGFLCSGLTGHRRKLRTKAEKERHSLTGSCKLLNMNGDFT
jgi:hypothetical protein